MVKIEDRRAASQLVEMLHIPTIDLDIFRRVIKNLKDCEEISRESTKESIEDDGFQRVLVRDGEGSTEGHGTLNMKNVCKVLQTQLELCGKKDITIHSERLECISEIMAPSITRNFFNRRY